MAGEAKSIRRGGDQLHARDILIHSDFMTICASSGNRCVHVLSVCFVRMALQALRRTHILVQRHGMDVSKGRRSQ